MAILGNLQFIANAQAVVVWGRDLTTAEKTSLNNAKIALINGGAQTGVAVTSNDETNTWTTPFSTLDAANSYVATCNTFSPAPQSATVTAV
jgi:hypothetical protein